MGTDRVFSVVACLALMPCNCISDRFTALTEVSPVIVAWGEVAILHCRTSIPYELQEVRWIRIKDGNYSIISIFQDSRDQQRCDLPEYIGRMEVMTEDLTHGRVALKVFHVSVSDEGTYRCFLQTDFYFDFGDAELRVTALGSPPRIDIEGFQDGGIKAVCRSAGWYPEPKLVNKDHDGEMKVQQEENGLYSIEYSRIITENSNRTFSCRLWTSFHRPDRETSVSVADDLFRKCADCSACIVFCVIACAAAAAAAFQVWTRYRIKQGSSSAVHTEPCYLKVPLDQGLSCVIEQSQVCVVKNTEGSPPVLQTQDTIEQPQVCAMKNTRKESFPLLQSQDTIEQSQVGAVKNTEGSPSVLQT